MTAPVTKTTTTAVTSTAPVTAPPAEPTPGGAAAAKASDSDKWPLVCGEVVDDQGVAVVGARVMLADLDLSARTDRRGHFCLAAPPGDRTMSVIAQGFAASRQLVSLGTQSIDVRVTLKPVQ